LVHPAFDPLLSVVDDVLSIHEPDVLLAKDIAAARPALSARDAVHVAVMERHGLHGIFSLDQGFDSVTGVERLLASPNRPVTGS
jgi:predicted nucleic acid-binding protein